MEVAFSDSFKKAFRKRIKDTATEIIFWNKLTLFTENPFQSGLKTHKLSGTLKGLWSFSIEYDMRVIFYFTKDNPPKAVFSDIGNHDEVY